MKKSRYKIARRFLIFWTLFISLGAIAGAVCLLIDPTGKIMGMDALLPYFKVLPFADILFKDFVFSGFALLIVNGLTNLAAAILLFMKKRAGNVLGGVFGVTLMLWICIQFYMFPPNFMSTIFFIFGFCQTVTGYAACVFAKQEAFTVNIADYPNIGKNPRRLVVFFSRMGYVKKRAYEEADKTGAEIYEIKSTEKTDGTLGFWWCGRFAMHHREMPIEDVKLDLSQYEHVTICSPVWVFSLAAPVHSFCKAVSGKIKQFDVILVHHTGGLHEKSADEIDSLLGVKRTALRSIQCKKGDYKKELSDGKTRENLGIR